MEETWALIQGVEECGGNKWADIKRRNLKAIEKRTAVSFPALKCHTSVFLNQLLQPKSAQTETVLSHNDWVGEMQGSSGHLRRKKKHKRLHR